MRDMTDEQLMQRYANGEAGAFDHLYARHRGALYRYFKRQVSDAATANDLYQGTWEKIIKARLKYSPRFPFTAWMYRIRPQPLGRPSSQKTTGQLDCRKDLVG